MKAAQTALGASAHNIANLSTADFRRDLVTQASAEWIALAILSYRREFT